MHAGSGPLSATRELALAAPSTEGCSSPRFWRNGPGDRLDLDPGTEHAATVGPSGCECVEAFR